MARSEKIPQAHILRNVRRLAGHLASTPGPTDEHGVGGEHKWKRSDWPIANHHLDDITLRWQVYVSNAA